MLNKIKTWLGLNVVDAAKAQAKTIKEQTKEMKGEVKDVASRVRPRVDRTFPGWFTTSEMTYTTIIVDGGKPTTKTTATVNGKEVELSEEDKKTLREECIKTTKSGLKSMEEGMKSMNKAFDSMNKSFESMNKMMDTMFKD